MTTRLNDILTYWDREDVESMYDKYLLHAEISLISGHIPHEAKILDAGCGEGEATCAYAEIPGVRIQAADFSETRLAKARKLLANKKNVTLEKIDFLGHYGLATDFDIIISQRLLINIPEWELQQKILYDWKSLLKPGGRVLLLEGSKQGAESLNAVRECLGLDPIPIKWHNLYFDDEALASFMEQRGWRLVLVDGLGTYFLLTRGIRPMIDTTLNWDSRFNELASTKKLEKTVGLGQRFSRLKLWIFEKRIPAI